MREVTYKTHWSYLGPAIKRKAPLTEFLLDIPYLLDRGVIPPFHVLNEVLSNGGNNGGMGPGTTWRRFTLQETEYGELVMGLLRLDVTEARKTHPYVRFKKIVADKDLHECSTYHEWLEKVAKKYADYE